MGEAKQASSECDVVSTRPRHKQETIDFTLPLKSSSKPFTGSALNRSSLTELNTECEATQSWTSFFNNEESCFNFRPTKSELVSRV